MKTSSRIFPAVPLALAAAALLSSSCATVEPESGDTRFKGYVVPSGPGVVWGRVILQGAAPGEQVIELQAGASRRNKEPLMTRRFVTDDDGGLANVFVHISRGLEGRRFEPPSSPVIVEGRDFQFLPAVTGVRVGQKLIWKTSDKNGYNIVSHPASPRNPAFNHLLMPNVTVETSYPAPEMFVRHETDAAPGTGAYVCVLEHPYFAVTDKHGMFALPPNLPPGRYTLTAQHATSGSLSAQAVVVAAENARVEFLFGAPGSGQISRVASVETLQADSKGAEEIEPARPPKASPTPDAPRKLVLSRTVIAATPSPTTQSLQPPARAPIAKPAGDSIRGALPPKAGAANEIVTRVFKVDAERLLKGLRDSYSGNADKASLQSLFGSALGKGPLPGAAGDFMPNVTLNADGGAMLVRANSSEMERIQSLIEVLDLPPAQVTLDARIMEVAVKDFDRYIESHPVYSQTLNTENFSGILTEAEFRDMLRQLAGMKGARLVYAPGVTALSGRPAEFQFDPETTLSIKPTVETNGEDVRMDVLFALFAPGEAKLENAKPDQSLKTTASVMNRQTIMLGGLIKVEGKGRNRFSSKDKNVIMLLITPTVVDSAGR